MQQSCKKIPRLHYLYLAATRMFLHSKDGTRSDAIRQAADIPDKSSPRVGAPATLPAFRAAHATRPLRRAPAVPNPAFNDDEATGRLEPPSTIPPIGCDGWVTILRTDRHITDNRHEASAQFMAMRAGVPRQVGMPP